MDVDQLSNSPTDNKLKNVEPPAEQRFIIYIGDRSREVSAAAFNILCVPACKLRD